MKDKYIKPEIELETFCAVDVLTLSGVGDPDDNDVPFGE